MVVAVRWQLEEEKTGASALIGALPRRPIIQPSSFKGEGDFKAWLDKFNQVAKVNEWDEQKKLDFFSRWDSR